MDMFKQSVNWSEPNPANQVNRIGQKMALEALERYIQGGNAALGTYRDKHNPSAVADTFQSLLSRSKALPVYLPELAAILYARTNQAKRLSVTDPVLETGASNWTSSFGAPTCALLGPAQDAAATGLFATGQSFLARP